MVYAILWMHFFSCLWRKVVEAFNFNAALEQKVYSSPETVYSIFCSLAKASLHMGGGDFQVENIFRKCNLKIFLEGACGGVHYI
jgi:hypothetical protein